MRDLAVAVLFCSAACSSFGKDEAGADSVTAVQAAVAEPPIVYRRIYVPANDPKSWPLELEKYLPIEAKEFTAIVSATSARAAAQATASVDSAEYSGRLDDDGMLRGHGKWTVDTRAGETVIVPIHQFSLTITNARWSEFQDQPVQLGVWGSDHCTPNEWGLLVPRTGTVVFDWAVRPQMQSDGLECAWHVPPATTNRIALELPAGQEPSLSGAVISGTAKSKAESQNTKATNQQWTIEFPTLRDATLQIVSAASKKRKPRDLGEVRELTEYRIQERGLDIRLSWDVSLGSTRQKELSIPLPNGVQVARVLLDGREGTWHLERGDKRSADKAIISLAPASDKRSLKIEVTAWQPLTLDESWQLPVLHAEGVQWCAGQFDFLISPKLMLRNLVPVDCGQDSIKRREIDGVSWESRAFTAYSTAAALEVAVSNPATLANVRIASLLALADPDVAGKLTTEWEVIQGSLYHLSGDLSPGWNIEAVETTPANALAEWSIDTTGERHRLDIQLTHAATPERRVSVQITGRLQRSNVSAPISTDVLRLIRWRKASETQHLLSFQTTDPFVAEPIGNMPFISREQIRNMDRGLIAAAENDTRVVDLAQADSGSALNIAVKRGQYTADVELDASCSQNEVKQTWRIAARPMSNAIDRLLIYSTAPIGENAKWSEGIANNPVVAERIRESDPQRKELPKQGELWLIRLSQPTSKLIELFATCTSNSMNSADIPLLSLPQAVEQHGLLTLRSSINDSPIVDAHGLMPLIIPMEGESIATGRTTAPIRAMYRYSPIECLETSHAPKISIGSSDRTNGASFIVRHLKLDSQIRPDGTALNCATYDLLCRGATEFKSPLANDVTIDAIFVNDRSVGLSTPSNKERTFPARIPLDSRESTVRIYFETHQSPLRPFCSVQPPVMRFDAPALESEWNVWLPDGFTVIEDRNCVFSWQERLFGPLFRSNSSPPFDPLHVFDWQTANAGTTDASNGTGRQQSVADGASPKETLNAASANAMSGSLEASTADRTALLNKYESKFSQPGWHVSRQLFAADDLPHSAFVSRPNVIYSWALGILIASYILGGHICMRHFGLLIAAITLAACFALALPAAVAPLATGALWGFVGCAIVSYSQRIGTVRTTFAAPASSGAISGAVFLCLVLAIGESRAEPRPATTSNRSSETTSGVEQLLIPIDENRKPVDTKYFISERFMHELFQRKSAAIPSAHKWLLRDATYVGDLTLSHEKSATSRGNWSLAFSIETLARGTTVRLPFIKEEAIWQPAAMLDGVPVPAEWSSDGKGCSVLVAEPGRYTLTLFCAPNSTTTDGEKSLALSIPAIISATVQIHTSGQAGDVKVAGATLIAPKKDESGIVSFELGDLNHLSVSWPSIDQKTMPTTQSFNVSEMSWLRIGTGQTVLDTKYIIDGNGQLPESVMIQYGPRWTPLSEELKDSQEGDETSETTRTLSATLVAGDNDRREANVRWKLNDSLTAGVLRIPPVSLANPQPTQRWLAISSDPKLDCTLIDNDTSVATPKEFLAKWGTGSQPPPPAAVVANFDANRVWTVAVRPHETDSSIREVLHIAAGLPNTRVIYQANVSPRGANQFGMHLTLPAQMAIDEISLAEGDRQIETRWAREDKNHINVFFAAAASNDYRLTLSGRMPAAANVAVNVPRVTALPTAATTQVQIYRDDEVEAELKGFPAADKTNAESIELPPIQWLVRSLGTYRMDEAAARTSQLVITPHRSKLTGDSMTKITREAGSWWLTFLARLTPKSTLDVLRIRFPAACSAPFDVEAGLPITTETKTNDHCKTLAIRFNASVGSGTTFELRIRTPLVTVASSRFAIPNVTIEGPYTGERYVNVPVEGDSGHLEWTTSGVERAQSPSTFSTDDANSTRQVQFRVVNDDWQVAATPTTTSAPQPRIPLADTSFVVGENGGRVCHSRFVLVPGGATECILELSPDEQLLSAEIDGHPALLSATDRSHWRIILDSQQLPEILEVVSSNSSRDSVEGKSNVRRPVLLTSAGPISVSMSLWSIAYPTGHHRLSVEGASPARPLDLAVLRFDRLVRTAESASSMAAEGQPDGINWFRTWASALQSARDDMQNLVKTPSAATSVAEIAPASGEQIKQISSRLDKWLEASTDLFGNVDYSSAAALSALNRGVETGENSEQQISHFIGEGDVDRLVLKSTDDSTAKARLQTAAVVAVICLGIAAAFLTRIAAVEDSVYRYPHALGVLAGIVYWAWLWPSWLGMMILVASAGLALKFSWPGRSIRPESSTVLRSTRTF